MNNNCHIPDLVQEFFQVKNGGFNFVLVWLHKYVDLKVTDESYVDKTRGFYQTSFS